MDQLAQSHWLLQRAIRFQNDCFTLAGIDNKTGIDNQNGVDEKRLALFIRYGSTHERAFHKALNTLLRLKRDRQKAQIAHINGFVSQKAALPPRNLLQVASFRKLATTQNPIPPLSPKSPQENRLRTSKNSPKPPDGHEFHKKFHRP